MERIQIQIQIGVVVGVTE